MIYTDTRYGDLLHQLLMKIIHCWCHGLNLLAKITELFQQLANLLPPRNKRGETFSFEELDSFCSTGMRPIGDTLGLLFYKGSGDEGKLYLN